MTLIIVYPCIVLLTVNRYYYYYNTPQSQRFRVCWTASNVKNYFGPSDIHSVYNTLPLKLVICGNGAPLPTKIVWSVLYKIRFVKTSKHKQFKTFSGPCVGILNGRVLGFNKHARYWSVYCMHTFVSIML